MKRDRKVCRCCGQETFVRLGGAYVAPFFQQQALQVEAIAIYQGRILDLQQQIPEVGLGTTLPYGRCEACQFLSVWPELSDDMLSDFYLDYGADSYKAVRSTYEPEYARIAEFHGCEEELALRRAAHEGFMLPLLSDLVRDRGRSSLWLLDYGGGAGKVAPQAPELNVDIWDIGEREVRSLHRADGELEGSVPAGGYDVVQLLHVLEHVGAPLRTAQAALQHLRPGGLFYLEIPMEQWAYDLVARGHVPVIDEHINKFNDASVAALVTSLGLRLVSVSRDVVPLLHVSTPGPVVRCVARRDEASDRV